MVPKSPLPSRSSRLSNRSCRRNRPVVPKSPLFSQSVVPKGPLPIRSSKVSQSVVPQGPLPFCGPAEAQGLPAVVSSRLRKWCSPAMHNGLLEGRTAGRSGSQVRATGRALEVGGEIEGVGAVRRTLSPSSCMPQLRVACRSFV